MNNVQAAKTTADTTVQVIAMIGTTTAVTASPNPANVGANVTLAARASPSAGTGVPTGTVTFNDGSTQLGTGTLNGSGQATYSTSSLAAGSHSITAVYGGDSTCTGSTSTALAEVVKAPSFSISVSPTTVTVTQGQSGQATVTMTPVGGFNSSIALSCSGQPASSTCTLSPTSVTPDGSNSAVTSAVSIATNVKTTAALRDGPRRRQSTALALVLFGLPGLCFFSGFRRRIGALPLVMLVLVLLGIEVGIIGCGGSGPTTPKGTSTITITANTGSTSQTARFTLTVQ